MMKPNRVLFILLLVGSAGIARAQQIGQFTQFMFNPLVINPAVAGTNNYYQIRSNHRFQWLGITDPPITNSLSIYGPHSKYDMGYGGYIISDVTGPTSRTGISGAYAYNIAVNDEMRVSMGLAMGLYQYKVDVSKIQLIDNNDPARNNVYSDLYPDAAIGVYLYATSYQVGFSADQLIPNKVKIYDSQTGLSKLKTHYYLTGSYRYYINRDWAIEPNVMIKGVTPVPIQMDLNVRALFRNLVWGGISWRTGDAISIILGYNNENKFNIGYSYDMGISSIRSYNSGSHELMISYRFNKVK
ncbi:MAG: type IX secretion system membrane protein PorP/SprF [Bacteroidales bacterium]|nr:type IX secretion system membrane protein PorP/SprF [Bacteroidales bacterium]